MEFLRSAGLVYRIQGKGTFAASDSGNARSKIISVVLPFAQYRDTARLDETNILKGIERRLSQRGYYTMLHYCKDDGDDFLRVVSEAESSVSIGIIIAYVAKNLMKCSNIYRLFSVRRCSSTSRSSAPTCPASARTTPPAASLPCGICKNAAILSSVI